MKQKPLQYIFILIFSVSAVTISIAQNVELKIKITDVVQENFNQQFSFKQKFTDTISCEKYIEQLSILFQSKGYISASVDSVVKNNFTYTAYVFAGEKYVWKELKTNPKDIQLLKEIGIQQNIFSEKPFNPSTVTWVQKKLLDYFETNGYPFAVVAFDSLSINDKEVSATLKIDKGILYKMDSIKLEGNAKISIQFLYKYLSVSPGSFYNIEKLQAIEKKLAELPFGTQTQPAQITMLGGSFIVHLFLENKKSNQVDAILGLMPNNQQTGGSLLLTVDAKLKLLNAFATGETIGVVWQQIQPKSPRLNLVFQRPFIFNSQFDFDFNFELYKKDSSFINIQGAVGIIYKPNAHQHLKLSLQSLATNLLDIDTTIIKQTKQLPNEVDVTTNSILIEYGFNNTNYKFNPHSGNEVSVSILTGSRKLRKNNTISQLKDGAFNFNTLYDSVQMNSYQLKIQLNAAHYFPLNKYSVIKTALQSGLIQSPTVFRNEMFQIGGLKLLRGFDEESIFTDKYAVATAEYRYLYGLNAYFNAFIDAGFTYNSLLNKNYNYLGFGGGISFETKQGIFNIALAVGKRNDESFNFRQSKIHIGFVSLF
ncbi:MAG: hypothetical protein LC134_00440 [Chitinophagales bacterium]|nr:hypothetical protein [Chitinophagaceae bacterium]MCZ2297925.1 hypothetical protein [Chitinophagales bacterium]